MRSQRSEWTSALNSSKPMPWSRSAKVPARMSSSTIFIALAACMMVSRPKQIALNPSCSNSLGERMGVRPPTSGLANCGTSKLRATRSSSSTLSGASDEDRLRAGVDVALGAPQRLVEAEHGACVGAHADERLGIKPLRHSGPDLGLDDFRRNDLLAGHMAAALGPSLVLEKDRARTHAFVGLNGVHGVLDVAVTVVDIDQNGHIAGRDDVAHRRRDVGEALEADIGHAIARAGDREAADEHGVESGSLDQQRAQRIVGAGNDEQSPLRNGSVERLAKTSSTAYGGLLMAGSAGAAIGRRLGMIGRHGAPPQLMQKAQHLLVRHVLALVIAIVMNNLVEGAADRGTAVDGGKADRQDMVDHQEIGHAEHALERLLDVDSDVLRAQPERCCGKMHQRRGVR